MAATCFQPILGKRIRVVALGECGNLPTPAAADKMVVTNGFVSVALSAQTEDGAEIIKKRADGSLHVNQKLVSSFKRFDVTIEFAGVDAGLLSLTTNAETYDDYGGFANGVTVAEGEMRKKFSLELWTGLSGEACDPGVEEASGYLLLPFLQAGIVGDLTFNSESEVSFSMTGSFTIGGNVWGVGPFNVLDNATSAAAPLPLALDALDHLLLVKTNIAPPASACGLVPYTVDTPPI